MGMPGVYPTGTTIYDKERACNGYTLYQTAKGAALIDMNGRAVKLWKGLKGFPNKLLPGGYVFGSTGERDPKYGFQDQKDLVEVDFGGRIVWNYCQNERIADPGHAPELMARQHHDFQRQGSTTGYYVPGNDPPAIGGNTLLLVHTTVQRPDLSEKTLLDDRIIEVSWNGKILWDWKASDHFDELGFDDTAKAMIYKDPNYMPHLGFGDWLHINCISTLGENKWYAQGDARFHPDNIIWDSREANILAITEKKTGKIVWRIGPDFSSSEQLRMLGQMIGQHHLHMIPKGLPGEGNLLVFDNGSFGGYTAARYGLQTDRAYVRGDRSRVVEFDPVTLEIRWQYNKALFMSPPPESENKREQAFPAMLPGNPMTEVFGYRFYSPLVCSAQRLENGNTLITEGLSSRIFEVTRAGETVWEYVDYLGTPGGIYRAYRYPYHWVPQLPVPEETSLPPLDLSRFRVPGTPGDIQTEETPVLI
jgi:hypothetical protein